MCFVWGWNCIYMGLRLCSDNRAIMCECVEKEGAFYRYSDLFVSYLFFFKGGDLLL